jgi:predicted RNase H-like HicB family nuclease
MKFTDYKIHIVDSSNYKDKFVAYIEEFHNVIEVIENKDDAEKILEPKFEKEIQRLKQENQPIPKPGTGKAKITFAANDKIEALRPLVDEFWEKILGTSYSTSFVSNESVLRDWEHYLIGGKEELIEKTKKEFNVDIGNIYEQPIYKILGKLKLGLN